MQDILFLISYIFSCCFYFKEFPEDPYTFYKLIPIQILLMNTLYKSGLSTRFAILFIAQFFSLLGDFFLLFPSTFFLYGIAAFLITQILYTYLFGIDFNYIFSLIFVSSLSTALFTILLYPNIQENTLLIAVLIYSVFITLMLWTAIALMQRQRFNLTSIIGFIGAVLFYISDFSIAINKWVSPFYYSQLLIMGTYYPAQQLISYAIIHAK